MPLATMSSASVIDGAIQRKISGRGGRARKGITLVILNEDVGDIRIIKSMENSGV